ncbi:MAG: phospholipase D family protein [Actinomycetota bacterium]|nr:phospholipase D family protein [Actinomycetota bacterium]
MAGRDPSTPSLLGDDAFGGGGPKLGFVRASFGGKGEASFEDLVTGYSRMRVLTYSSSVPIINEAARTLDELEVVFGRADVLGEMRSYLYYQEVLMKELIEGVRGEDHIKEKMDAGSVRLYVVQEAVSHEKLFLLDGGPEGPGGREGTRVITGSANFSNRAFSGRQNEGLVLFDDDAGAWEHYDAAYEKIKARSTTTIIERAHLDGSFDPANLPALAPAREGKEAPKVIVIQDRPSEPDTVEKALSSRLPKGYPGLSSVLETKNGAARLDRQKARQAVRYLKSNARTEGENPEEWMSLDLSSDKVVVSGEELDLTVADAEVAQEARAWVEYFAGYAAFKGEPEKLQRDYFTFWSWLYAGPTLCDLRNAALARGEDAWDYPIFGILYGKSNCGKSELVKTLMLSMFGKEGFPPNEWLTKSRMASLREENRRYPLVFDDVDKTRFANHAEALIKEDYVPFKEYPPVVLSMNAGQDAFASEIRKRALIVYTGASLPDHTGEAREHAKKVRGVKARIGTALYREYLGRLLTKLREHSGPLPDALRLSSSVLAGILAEHASEPLPDWCRTVTTAEHAGARHDRVREELLQLWRHDKDAWSRKADKVVFRSEDVHGTIAKLRRDVPDYLYGSGSKGNIIVFDAEELERFLGIRISPARGLWGSLAGRLTGQG